MSEEVDAEDSRTSGWLFALIAINVVVLPLLLLVTWDTSPGEGYWTAVLTILTAYPALLIAVITFLYSLSPARVQLAFNVFRASWRFITFIVGIGLLVFVLLAGFRGLVTPNPDLGMPTAMQVLTNMDYWIAPLSISLLFIGLEITGLLALDFIRLQTPQNLARRTRDLIIRNPEATRPLRKRLVDVTEGEARHNDDDFEVLINSLIRIAIADGEAALNESAIAGGETQRLADAGEILEKIVHLYTTWSSNRDIGTACLEGLLVFARHFKDREVQDGEDSPSGENDPLQELGKQLSDGQIVAAMAQSDHPSVRQVKKYSELAWELNDHVSKGNKADLVDQLWKFWTTSDLPDDVEKTLADSMVSRFSSNVIKSKLNELASRPPNQETLDRDLRIIGAFLAEPMQAKPLAHAMVTYMVPSIASGRSGVTAIISTQLAKFLEEKGKGNRTTFRNEFIRQCAEVSSETAGIRWGAEVLARSVIERCKSQPELIRGKLNQFTTTSDPLHALTLLDPVAAVKGLSDAFQGDWDYSVIRLAREQLAGVLYAHDKTLRTVPLVAAAGEVSRQLVRVCSAEDFESESESKLPAWVEKDEAFLVDLKESEAGLLQMGLPNSQPEADSPAANDVLDWVVEQLTSMVGRLEAIRGFANGPSPAIYHRLSALGLVLSCDVHVVRFDSEILITARRFADLLLAEREFLDTSDATVSYAGKVLRAYFIDAAPTWEPEAVAESSDSTSVLVLRRLSREVFLDQQEFAEPWLELVREGLRKTTIPHRRQLRSMDILTAEGLTEYWESQFEEFFLLPAYEDLSSAAVDAFLRNAPGVVGRIISAAVHNPGNQGWDRAFISKLKDACEESDAEVMMSQLLLCDPSTSAVFVPYEVSNKDSAQLLVAMVSEGSFEPASLAALRLCSVLPETWQRRKFVQNLEKFCRDTQQAVTVVDVLSLEPKFGEHVLQDATYPDVCDYIVRSWRERKDSLAESLLVAVRARGGGHGWQRAFMSELAEAAKKEEPQINVIKALEGHPDSADELRRFLQT